MTTNHEELDAIIAALGIKYKAEFVPQKLSRNCAEKQPSLNWRVTLIRKDNVFTTDYMQGVGHLPKFKGHLRDNGPMTSTMKRNRETRAAATGLVEMTNFKEIPVPEPLLRDVLYCLVSDTDVSNYDSFEDWADCFGYDRDSRKAEDTYNACWVAARQLRGLFTTAELNSLREAFQDY